MTIPTDTFALLMPILAVLFKSVLVVMGMGIAAMVMYKIGGPHE